MYILPFYQFLKAKLFGFKEIRDAKSDKNIKFFEINK